MLGTMMIALLIPNVVDGCPSCKLVDDPIVQGFKWSILFLMAMPYTVFGLIGGGVFYMYKRVNPADNHEPHSDAKGV
jgi:hypothetical protein